MTELADAAFRQVAPTVIETAIRTGTPVIIWKDGQVQKIDRNELAESMLKSAESSKPP